MPISKEELLRKAIIGCQSTADQQFQKAGKVEPELSLRLLVLQNNLIICMLERLLAK